MDSARVALGVVAQSFEKGLRGLRARVSRSRVISTTHPSLGVHDVHAHLPVNREERLVAGDFPAARPSARASVAAGGLTLGTCRDTARRTPS